MFTLLALFGLGVLLYHFSKALTKGGEWMERMGERLSDYNSTIRESTPKDVTEDNKKLNEQIKEVSGKEETNEEYSNRVRKEIDEITGS